MSASADDHEVLKRRARELAREPEPDALASEYLEVVEFALGGGRYAIELACVREISRLKILTPVPCTPAFVLGIVNLRGEIRTVIDLKRFFDLPPNGITELSQIILIRHDDVQLGVLADAIAGARRIPLAGLQPPLPTLSGVQAEYLRGVTSEGVVVLDAMKILSDPAVLVNEKIAT